MQLDPTDPAAQPAHLVTLDPVEGGTEAMVRSTVQLGQTTRLDLELSDGTAAEAVLTDVEAQTLEVANGDIIYVRAALAA